MAPQEGRQALVERGEGCHRLTALESQAANVNGGGAGSRIKELEAEHVK